MDFADELGAPEGQLSDPPPDNEAAENTPAEQLALVKKIQDTIRLDKRHHDGAFKQMRRDMFIAKHGRVPEYDKNKYTANIIGRLVKMKTASLYAKNPKAVARRKESLDFTTWDEDPASLQMAMQTSLTLGPQVQVAAQAPTAPSVDPATGAVVPAPEVVDPQMVAMLEEATAIIQDYRQGMQRRKQLAKLGKTLEILFSHALREQKPVDFKTGAKQMVRRACTTGVGYVELGFQRETGPRPATTERLADARARLAHLQNLVQKAGEGEIEQDDPEIAELEASIQSLIAEPEIVLREGLIFDFPQSTKVIPDRMTRQIVGFVGARHLTLEYLFTPDEVQEMFKADVKNSYTGYQMSGLAASDNSANTVPDDVDSADPEVEAKPTKNTGGLVLVWKHYDKTSGLVYYVADGHPKFLREPAAPDVFVEDFWPVYALTFNAMESEDELFPPSDVQLLTDMQMEHNRSRQGKRDHRYAAQPRWAASKGALGEEDAKELEDVKPFETKFLDIGPDTKLSDILQSFPVPGVDPNLYSTEEFFSDAQVVVGAQEAQLGGLAKATATESAIAANSTAAGDSSSVDDLDAFLTVVARASGQIMLREMSEEQVKTIVGVGAFWPEMTLAEIASEVFLEVEAGSSGKPNQAIEIDNWKNMAPILQQTPGVNPNWFARETVRRLDDRIDLTEAVTEGMPSMVAQNALMRPTGATPESDPASQGANGAQNAPAPDGGEGGSGPAFGSNQT